MSYKSLIIVFFGLFASIDVLATDPISKIANANEAKELAMDAYVNHKFEDAVKYYTYLLDSLDYDSDEARLNRAHAYFQLKDTINAFDGYRSLSTAENKEIRSTAFLQMGNLSEQQKEYENALSYFKEALKTNPANQEARYNYELLKKKMKEQEKQQQNQENKDQQGQDKENQEKKENEEQENKEGKDGEKQKEQENQEKSQEDKEGKQDKEKQDAEDSKEGKEGEEKSDAEQKKQQEQQNQEAKEGEKDEQPMEPSTREKLQQMNVSEEKAKMILEALRNKEAQYFQQMRKKATEKPKSNKPDW